MGRIHNCVFRSDVTADAPEGGSEGEMSSVEYFERDCAYCRQPIRLKWKNGPVPVEGVRLVADQVFHDKCWEKYWPRALGPGGGSSVNQRYGSRCP